MRILIAILLLVVFHLPASAEFGSSKEVTQWFTFYYQKPEPEKIPDAIEYMIELGILDNKDALAPTVGFLAGGFRENPDRVADWVDQLSALNDSHFQIVIFALWHGNLPESQARVYELLDSRPNLKEKLTLPYQSLPIPVEEIPLEQGAWVLDALWGNFMVTGNKTPVIRMMTTLPWIDKKEGTITRHDIDRLLIGSAARWSLISNATQHPRVLEICETEVENQPEEVANKLREVIAEAKEKLEKG